MGAFRVISVMCLLTHWIYSCLSIDDGTKIVYLYVFVMQGLNTVHLLWESFMCPVVSDSGFEPTLVRACHDALMNIMLSISENTIMNCYLFSFRHVSIIFSCNSSL